MKVLLQRVSSASVSVDGSVSGAVGPGLLALTGFGRADSEKDLEWMAGKITGLRVFPDSRGNMNLSVCDIQGEILLVSQFTLHADCRKGRRPSFMKAAPPDRAEMLFDIFTQMVAAYGRPVQTGIFGAMMKVELVNDGPVTLMINSPSELST
ncbi:MAG: D-tyrosyl-tRNA(Tyr) deacylase [Candidatus Aegiribacteria sp.]|nr:D-tyrosyl-tRNA(Tyr) deacylase [Candidatus Aegiribacteria sp.]MBD3295063.1 D-tyrosyl-tRNA(Tyr) deacylase [Candidatus Fermentibacteria bacterium]